MMLSNIRIGVLMGGPSSEREVSLSSGKAVLEAFKSSNLEAVGIDIQRPDKNYVQDLLLSYDIGLAFLTLHGGFGEDGRLQAILEEMGLAYTGSGPKASALAMDKIASRKIFQEAGLDVPDCCVLDKKHRPAGRGWQPNSQSHKPEGRGWQPNSQSHKPEGGGLASNSQSQRRLKSGGTFPLVVKPAGGGSSIGLSIVDNPAELARAVDTAFSYDKKVMLEEYIEGREMTVGILEDGPLKPIEIRPQRRFFDYKAKYDFGSTEYIVPAPVPSGVMHLLQDAALRAHKGLGCSFFSRVDIILSPTNRPFILELNTIPGFTATSLLPKAALEQGMTFSELVVKISQAALAKSKVRETSEMQIANR